MAVVWVGLSVSPPGAGSLVPSGEVLGEGGTFKVWEVIKSSGRTVCVMLSLRNALLLWGDFQGD